MLDPSEKILLYLTGNATKYLDLIKIKREELPVLTRDAGSLN